MEGACRSEGLWHDSTEWNQSNMFTTHGGAASAASGFTANCVTRRRWIRCRLLNNPHPNRRLAGTPIPRAPGRSGISTALTGPATSLTLRNRQRSACPERRYRVASVPFEDKFLAQAGGDPQRAESLRKAHFDPRPNRSYCQCA